MTDIHVRSQTTDTSYYQDASQIAVKKKHIGAIGVQLDKTEKSTAQYQEDYIPPANYPQLDPFDPHASGRAPKSGPTVPNQFFKDQMKGNVDCLGADKLAGLMKNGLTLQQARNLVYFSYTHPNYPVNPEVATALAFAKQQTGEMVKEFFNLPPDWEPDQPDTNEIDESIRDTNNQNFENYLRNHVSDPADRNALLFAHYHPEVASELDGRLANILTEGEKEAAQQTHEAAGLPSDWEIPRDSTEFDAQINSFYERNFNERLARINNLTPNQRAIIKTLHYAPNAKISRNATVEYFLKLISQNALADTVKQFNLPPGVKLGFNAELFKGMLNGAFEYEFQKNAMQLFPNDPAKRNLLLATKGLSSEWLPQDVKAAFDQASAKALNTTIDKYGLPAEWRPSTGTQDITGSLGLDSGDEEVEGEEKTQEPNKAWSNISVGTNRPVSRVKLGVNQKNGEEIQGVDGKPQHDYEMGMKILDGYSDFVDSSNDFGKRFLLGPDQRSYVDLMLVISSALDNLRQGLFACQKSEALAMRTVARMQQDINMDKNRLQQIQHEKYLEELRKGDDKLGTFMECFGWGLLFIPIVGQILGPELLVLNIASTVNSDARDALNSFSQTLLWQYDIMSGGSISMLAKTARLGPISKNPLQAMGWISPKTAEIMDTVLQIVFMVADIVIGIVTAQPEFVASVVSSMSQRLAALGAKESLQAASKMAAKATLEIANKGLQTVAKETVSQMQRVIIATARESAEELSKVSVKAGAKAAAKVTVEQTRKVASMLVENSIQALQKAGEVGKSALETTTEIGSKVGRTVSQQASHVGQQIQLAGRTLKSAGESAVDGIKASSRLSASQIKDLEKAVEKESREMFKAFLKEAAERGRNFAKTLEAREASMEAAKDYFKELAKESVSHILQRMGMTGSKTTSEVLSEVFFKAVEYSKTNMTKLMDMIVKNEEVYEQSLRAFLKNPRKATRALEAVGSKLGDLKITPQHADILKSILEGTVQIAGNLDLMFQHLKNAEKIMEKAMMEARIKEDDAFLHLMRKASQEFVNALEELGKWVDQINKQEAEYWQKSQIHYIPAA